MTTTNQLAIAVREKLATTPSKDAIKKSVLNFLLTILNDKIKPTMIASPEILAFT